MPGGIRGAPPGDDALRAAVREGFGGGRALVIGDLMLDRYVHGAVERISPEAPVPVVHVERRAERPGGAGNVAANLAGLGLRVSVAGWVGEDEAGEALRNAIAALGARCDGVLALSGRPTTVKTRVIGGAQQMIRLDVEEVGPIDGPRAEPLLDWLADPGERFEVVVVSDYAKGAMGDARLPAAVVERFRDGGVPVLVDAKGRHLRRYAGATAATPNRDELSQAAHLHAASLEALLEAGHRTRDALALDFLLLTLGADGMVLLDAEGERRLPSVAREVYDVSGAGDTVVATLAASLSAGLPTADAAWLANLAAGIVVGKVGTAPVSREELLVAMGEARPAGSVP